MKKLSDIGTIKEILGRHGFTFSKSLGQNFLINPSVCPRMAEMSGADSGVGVIEVGPGIGVLTCELCRRAEKVVAVELDKRLLPVLDETLAEFDNVKVVNADVLELDLNRLIAEEFPGMEVVVCANLPYYITSPVIMKLLEDTASALHWAAGKAVRSPWRSTITPSRGCCFPSAPARSCPLRRWIRRSSAWISAARRRWTLRRRSSSAR